MKAFIEKTFDQQVKDLQSLVRIPSVSRGEPKENMPYGERVDKAWQEAARIARDLGFEKVYDVGHRCGVIEYGEGEEIVAIMAHLDVVPEGVGWTYPPYGAEIHDGRIFGRGTLDDKGSAVNALYALAALKDSGIPMKRRARVLLGLDEECGSTGMAYYREVEGEPAMAFTPDAVYPVVNSEMGILHITYETTQAFKAIVNVGTVQNAIPGEASAVLPSPTRMTELPEGLTLVPGENGLLVRGKGGHGSMPELAHNALHGLFYALKDQVLPEEEKAFFTKLSDSFKTDCHGESLGVDREDESGRITLAPTMFYCGKAGAKIVLDVRYPFSLKYEELREKLDSAMAALSMTCTSFSNTEGHFVPAGSELVTTLMDVYREVTGDKNAKPLSMGGGTYAKEFKNAVAFGPVFPGEVDMCHMPDESVALEDIKTNTLIMAEAMKRFCC